MCVESVEEVDPKDLAVVEEMRMTFRHQEEVEALEEEVTREE